jgi:hypothetical protein
MIERNAIIKSTSLSSADHGLLASFLHLDFGGEGQDFGGWQIYAPGRSDAAGLWVWRCMECADVTEWSDLPGRPIRTRGDHSRIEAIGHIIKDIWFNPAIEFENLRKGN